MAKKGTTHYNAHLILPDKGWAIKSLGPNIKVFKVLSTVHIDINHVYLNILNILQRPDSPPSTTLATLPWTLAGFTPRTAESMCAAPPTSMALMKLGMETFNFIFIILLKNSMYMVDGKLSKI